MRWRICAQLASDMPEDFCENRVKKLHIRWKKFVVINGNYVEKRRKCTFVHIQTNKVITKIVGLHLIDSRINKVKPIYRVNT